MNADRIAQLHAMLSEARATADAATPGPWLQSCDPFVVRGEGYREVCETSHISDAVFIAAAPELTRSLADALEEALAECARLQKALDEADADWRAEGYQ